MLFAAGSSSSATVIGMSALAATVETIEPSPQRPTNAKTSGRESDRHADDRARDRRGAGELAPHEYLAARQPVDERRRNAAADDRRYEPDDQQQRHLRNRRRRFVHPADEHGDHQPVAEVRDALAEREVAECGRPQRPLEPLRDRQSERPRHASQLEPPRGAPLARCPPPPVDLVRPKCVLFLMTPPFGLSDGRDGSGRPVRDHAGLTAAAGAVAAVTRGLVRGAAFTARALPTALKKR